MSRRKEPDISMIGNALSYNMYYNRLIEIALTTFEWEGLPPTVDEEYLERSLLTKGAAVFFEDEVLGILALDVNFTGRRNVYNYPTEFTAYSASNPYHKQLDITNGVIVFNNVLRRGTLDIIAYYAKRLWNLDRIIDINANAQKTPVLLVGSRQQMLSLKNTYMQWDGNEPVIYGDKDFDINALKALKTDAPYKGKELYELKKQIWEEALTYLGVTSTPDKKERMISSEVLSGMGSVYNSRYSRLVARQRGAKRFNKMFGYHTTVHYREDYTDLELAMADLPGSEEESEGNEDE